MNGSIKIAQIAGIPVLIHWSFALLFVYVFYIGNSQNLELYQMLWLGLFVLALFACVVMHEFGHALTARRFGVHTKDIILLPIGGVARLTKLPEKPMQEFLVAIAGPLINIALAIFLSSYYLIFSFPSLIDRPIESETDLIGDYAFFIPSLIFLNIVLALFNLLPAFPMDGGRILRSLLATKMGRVKATRIAAFLGQGIAFLMVFYGIMEFSITTALIGIFIFFTAGQEYRWAKREGVLSNYLVKHVARNQFTKLKLNEPMSGAYDLLLRNGEKSFIVYNENDELIGTLPEWAVMSAKRNAKLEKTVSEFFSWDIHFIDGEESLKKAAEFLHERGTSILAVKEDDKLIGVIDIGTIENVLSLNRA